tara:strand:+ start:14685 stop:15449 length:765 start_codon:yes stop_codon:yes gene_type:complete
MTDIIEILEQVEVLKQLKEDVKYYGSYGKQWLSNSDIGDLLNDPKSFRQKGKQTKAMLEGRYFHTAMLEPEKLNEFIVLDMKSRNSRAYKENVAMNSEDNQMCLLAHEVEYLNELINTMKGNFEMHSNIYDESNQFEVPMVKNIMGINWKGKADIVCPDKLIDIKTTSDLSKFKYSASKYNYDSQAYIYQELFKRPLEFYVIDKNTKNLAIIKTSAEFVERGRDKVERAVDVYNTFFTEDAPEDINSYIHYETL